MNYLKDLTVVEMYKVKPGDVVSTEWSAVETGTETAYLDSNLHYTMSVVAMVPLTQGFKEVVKVYDHPVSAQTTFVFTDKTSMRHECTRKVIKLHDVGADMFKSC